MSLIGGYAVCRVCRLCACTGDRQGDSTHHHCFDQHHVTTPNSFTPCREDTHGDRTILDPNAGQICFLKNAAMQHERERMMIFCLTTLPHKKTMGLIAYFYKNLTFTRSQTFLWESGLNAAPRQSCSPPVRGVPAAILPCEHDAYHSHHEATAPRHMFR